MDHRDNAAAAIASAQASLEQAMLELAAMPAVSSNAVAFAAHALNNYLGVTGGVADLLGTALAGHPDGRVHTWLDSIQRATNMMGQIVGALMKDALVSGDAQITLRRVDLNVALGTICQYYQAAAARKSSWIVWEPLPVVAYAWTDSAAVAAVMDNLLSNALKYAPPGTQITVSMRAETPAGEHLAGGAAAYVVLVRDQGPGIGVDDRERLFQRGVRLSARPTGDEPSHGYGLAVAKELLGLLGGEIWCESELGAGATFLFRLPAWRGEAA